VWRYPPLVCLVSATGYLQNWGFETLLLKDTRAEVANQLSPLSQRLKLFHVYLKRLQSESLEGYPALKSAVQSLP
jgi:hypothetical protein